MLERNTAETRRHLPRGKCRWTKLREPVSYSQGQWTHPHYSPYAKYDSIPEKVSVALLGSQLEHCQSVMSLINPLVAVLVVVVVVVVVIV